MKDNFITPFVITLFAVVLIAGPVYFLSATVESSNLGIQRPVEDYVIPFELEVLNHLNQLEKDGAELNKKLDKLGHRLDQIISIETQILYTLDGKSEH